MTDDAPLVVFFPEQAYGPTNNCVGIGQELLRRGLRVCFIVEESFAGTLTAQGFEERVMRLTPPPTTEEAPGQFWTDFIRETAPVFRASTREQLEGFVAPTWQALVDGARYVDGRLEELLDELAPDVIVEDNVVTFPAVLTHGAPWVRIMSCNPLELGGADLPPAYSGLPAGDPSDWEAFRAEAQRTTGTLHAAFDAFCQEKGCPPLPPLEFLHESPHLNLYVFPAEADYLRQDRPLGAAWTRIDSCVRDAAGAGPALPAHIAEGPGALVYLSLGSLGSADIELMQRLIDVLATTAHRYVVSLGPLHEQLRLASNMWGEEFLDQPALLPLCDLVITHGGNNTVTECFHHGKPMIVAPIFWDQHDNAQRVAETGFGLRLNTYAFADDELRAAVDQLAADHELRARMAPVARRLQSRSGREEAAALIERVARAQPVGAGTPRTDQATTREQT